MKSHSRDERRPVPPFDRDFFRSTDPVMRIGAGELGGKAHGLLLIRDLLAARAARADSSAVEVHVPTMVVLTTDVFDAFVERNGLRRKVGADLLDERVADRFRRAELPTEVLGDLRALIDEVRTPLAIRSSSLLEDALRQPFAGVYETKMVPNNQPDADTRFRKLVEAVKFVYASTYFENAVRYIEATDYEIFDEKMAVIIQELVGDRRLDRYYPEVSGVARSYNFFPSGGANPRDGVVNLALGLGKTIVDGGVSWIYTPTRPKAPPPFGSPGDRLDLTQREFWAVNMGPPPAYNPTGETEYLVRSDLAAADYDGTLGAVASTYDAQRDRFVPGAVGPGPRVVDFAPLLVHGQVPLNEVIRELLVLGERALGDAVELEFAVRLPTRDRPTARFGVLQLRPMLVSAAEVEIGVDELTGPNLLFSSDRVMGNGTPDGIHDVVYVRPGSFESRLTPVIAGQLATLNRSLVESGRPYLLIGFGRWGSSDPWLGIPVEWSQIAGARVIVESTLRGMDVEPSQGAHFFHNIIGFEAFYLCVRDRAEPGRGIDWDWLDRQPAVTETDLVRHVRLRRPLRVKVDGRSGRGAVWYPPGAGE